MNSENREEQPLVAAGSEAVTRLDARLAFAITLLPVLGTALAAGLWAVGYGPSWIDVTFFALLYAATALGLEVGFHRHVTHKSYEAKPWVRAAMIASGSMAIHGPVIWWSAIHRYHHAHSDVAGDPHSPHLNGDGFLKGLVGLYHSHMGWLFTGESTRPIGWQKYVRDLYQDPLVFSLHMQYYRWVVAGLLLPTIVCGIITGSWMGALLGFLWGGMVRIFAVSHCIWALNSFCHVIGKRQFRTTKNDQSRNSFLLALLTFGQGWHNNHHAFPSSAFTGLYWWQIDIGGACVGVLQRLGLVWNAKRPHPETLKRQLDSLDRPQQ